MFSDIMLPPNFGVRNLSIGNAWHITRMQKVMHILCKPERRPTPTLLLPLLIVPRSEPAALERAASAVMWMGLWSVERVVVVGYE